MLPLYHDPHFTFRFADDRIIDLSRAAAEALDMRRAGVGEVRVRYLGRAPRAGGGTVLQYADAGARPSASSSVPTAVAAGPVPYLASIPESQHTSSESPLNAVSVVMSGSGMTF